MYSCFSNSLITWFLCGNYHLIYHSSGVNMSITAEVCEYFKNIIKPLVTNQSLKELLCKFKEVINSKFEDKFREQNLKIQELEPKIHSQENAFKY